MSNWDDLSIRERADLIRMYMDGGILDLPSMRKHYNSFAGGGDKGIGLGIFRRRSSAPELPEIDMSSVDADISDANNRLDYYLKESEAKKYFDSTTPADRYYDRLEKQDIDSKKFLSELYSGRSSMFPELNMSSIFSSLGQGYKIDSSLSDKTAGYYNPYTGINYAPYSYNTSHYYMRDASVHERTHSLGLTDQENKIKSYIDTSYQDYDNNGKPYYGFLRDGVQYDPYLDDPSEIYARRNAFLQYMKNYGNTYSGETKDGRIVNDLTPDTTNPIGGRWIEAIKSNGNAHEIDTFSTPVDMFDERYWDDSFNERRKTNNFLERYSPEFIMFLLNGVASNSINKSLTENNNIAAYGKELNKYSPSQSIKDYIKRTEAFRSNWYLDGNGVPTVGYGFTGEYYKNKYPNGMTREQADKEFDRVLDKFAGMVKTHTPNYDSLSQNQKDALLSYMYNVGPGNYTTKSPKFQQALKDKDWNSVASHMDIGYNDKRNPGLRKRRDYERELFLNSTSPSSPYSFASFPNYYEETKNNTRFSLDPAAYSTPQVGMPSLYYAQSSPYRDVDFSDLDPIPDLDMPNSSYAPVQSRRRTAQTAPQASYSIPTNEQIIGDLFNRINGMENVFAFGGDAEEDVDFIGPVLKTPVVPQRKEDFEIALAQAQPQVSTLYTQKPMNIYSQQQISNMFEDMETRKKYDDRTYQVADDVNPSDINGIVNGLQRQDSKKEIQKYYSLKGEDAKRMQQELADEGYYSSILDGMSKEQIKATQLKLVQKGLLSNEKDANGNYKEVDGIAGKKTRAAFNSYQVDGIVGKNTRYAIELREQRKNSSVAAFPDNSKVVAQKDKCAAFVRQRFNEATGNKARDLGVSGNAWTMLKSVEKAGGTMVYNVFDSDSFKNVTTGNVRNLTSSEMKKHPFDTSALQPGDIIGIYNPGTSHYAEVLKDGSTYNSHVGICTGYKDGKPIIEHAVNGKIIKQTADTVKIAAVARPANSKFTEMNIGDSEEQKYYVKGQEENPLLNEYSRGLNNSAKYMSKVFPEVNFDNVQQIALSVLKRETGYMTNTESMQREKSAMLNLKYGAKDFYKYNIKGESQEQKSSDLGKFKLSSLTSGEREMLGIDSPEDLNNPTTLSKAVTYYLAKNYTYFQNLSKKYPELGLTEEDIINLTTISYNQGMDNLKSIGFKDGKIAPEEIRAIRDSANNDDVVDDIKSTTWSRGGKVGEFIGKTTGWYTKSTSYSSSARRERENNIYTLSDTTG